jgi:hypothetical protein
VSMFRTCQWPLDESGPCSNPIHKKSYCEKHYAIAYRPMQAVHPLLVFLAENGPHRPNTRRGRAAYYGLLRQGLVCYRNGTMYLTEAGKENTLGY